MYEYKAYVEGVVDGDTVDVRIDLGFDVWVRRRIRLADIDTPESRTRDLREKRFGKLAAARVKELLLMDQKYVMRTFKGGRSKFGRVLADFDLPELTITLCEALVAERLAIRYHGQSKADVRSEHEANWDILEKQYDG